MLLRIRFFAVPLALILATIAGQPARSQTAMPTPPSPQPIKAAAEGNFEWFFVLIDVANEQGLWRKHGLAPEFSEAPPTGVQFKQRVDAGVKVGYANTAEATLARASGVPIKTVTGYLGETIAKLYVLPSGPIKSVNDLDRKKIGILANTHTSYRTVLYLNKKLSIQAEPVPLGALANNVAALKAGQIDAFYSSEGAALALADQGDVRLLIPLSEVYPKPYTAVVVWATEDAIEKTPDLVRAFVVATLESAKYVQDHPDEASALYAKRTGAAKNVADKVIGALKLSPSGRGSGDDLAASVAGNWQFMRESGAVSPDTRVNIEDVVDPRFVK